MYWNWKKILEEQIDKWLIIHQADQVFLLDGLQYERKLICFLFHVGVIHQILPYEYELVPPVEINLITTECWTWSINYIHMKN